MKTCLKRIFGLMLTTILVITMAPNSIFKVSATNASAQSGYATGDIINFGSYPQTIVTDVALISTLNSCILFDDNTVEYGGSKYKKVYFSQYTPLSPSLTPDAANSCQDDNGYYINTVYWFKFEDIRWRVLYIKNGTLFVMAEKILDSKAYNQVVTSVTWETCSLRSWLNNDFYNSAFSSTYLSRLHRH